MKTLILILAAMPLLGQFTGSTDLRAYWPAPQFGWSSSYSTRSINAVGEKFATCGSIQVPGYGTKAIRKAGFRFATVTKSSGSTTLTVSLQNLRLDTVTAPRPDETQDETYTVTNGDAGFDSSRWYWTGNLSADRTVSHGSRLCLVVEIATYGGSDVVGFNGINANPTWDGVGGLSSIYDGGAWTTINAERPLVGFEFSDGTFGTFVGHTLASAIGTTNVSTSTTPDEVGNVFTVSQSVKIDAIWSISLTNTRNTSMILYNGTTSIASCSFDANEMQQTTAQWVCPIAEQTLTPWNTYRVVVRPDEASTIAVTYYDLPTAATQAANAGGLAIKSTSRVDAGSWTDLDTRVYNAGVRISSIPAGGGSYTWQQ